MSDLEQHSEYLMMRMVEVNSTTTPIITPMISGTKPPPPLEIVGSTGSGTAAGATKASEAPVRVASDWKAGRASRLDWTKEALANCVVAEERTAEMVVAEADDPVKSND
eukprot:326864_1